MSEFEAEAEAKGFIDLSDVADEQLVGDILFNDPAEFEAHEYNLTAIVQERLDHQESIGQSIFESPVKANSDVLQIKDTEKILNFDEDVEEFERLETWTKSQSKELEGTVAELNLKNSKSAVVTKEWAVKTHLKEEVFEKLRPNLALQYEFELDKFQKQVEPDRVKDKMTVRLFDI